MKSDSLGDRMKSYEVACRSELTKRLPIILRVDGRAFHTYTRGCQKPFDDRLMTAMNKAATSLCESIQGAQIAYVQSDEISILVHNYKRLTSGSWFDNEIQKMVSVSAGIASSVMTQESPTIFGKMKPAVFDARVFVLPEADVCNYFLWRQQDATRNSIQMIARSLYSDKECFKKNGSELQEMIFLRGQNWNDVPTALKRGRAVVKQVYDHNGQQRTRWAIDAEIPVFSQDRDYINKFLAIEEDKVA